MAEISTTPVGNMSVSDAYETAYVQVHSCNVCHGLVLARDAREHLWWHQSGQSFCQKCGHRHA